MQRGKEELRRGKRNIACNMTSRDYRASQYNLYMPVHGHSVVVIEQSGSAHS